MHIVVIGGTRHVGPFLVRELVEAGHGVTVYNRGRTSADLPDKVKHIKVDRKVRGQIGRALKNDKPDAVMDMIAFAVEEIEEVVSAVSPSCHYVFCGSTVVYGVIGHTTPSETSPLDDDSEYGRNKVACERFMAGQAESSGFNFTSLRLAHPYGPGDHILYNTGRESLFLDRMRKGRPIIIPSTGQSRIHAIYAKDAARAFVHVLHRPECLGKIYNLAGEQILTLNEYFESIARALGVPLVARTIPHTFFRDNTGLWSTWKRKFDFGYTWVHYESAFNTTALRETGFRCLTDHDTGIALTMEWLDANGLVDASSDHDEEDRILKM